MSSREREVKSGPSMRDRALDRILAELDDGLRHGYFEFAISCEITGQNRRRLVLRAGKTHQFLLSPDECDHPSRHSADSRHGSDANER